LEPFTEFDKLNFTFAKTMADNPHEYVARRTNDEALYIRLFETIGELGTWEKYKGARYKCWYPGDGYKYWRGTTNIHQSRVINRCGVEPATIARLQQIADAYLASRPAKKTG